MLVSAEVGSRRRYYLKAVENMAKKKSKAQIEREKVLAALDAQDNQVEANPSKFGEADEVSKDTFENLFVKSLDERDFKVGDVVKGEVVEVQEDYVLVDINYKSEGLI